LLEGHNLFRKFSNFIVGWTERAAIAVSDNGGTMIDNKQSMGAMI
jgi:hypothetical protein